jgi:alanine racemase
MSGTPEPGRATWVEVDLDAVRHNVGALRPDGADLMAVVKADGYGHGATRVALAALEAGASWLGVALAEEGFALRDARIDAPILVLSEVPAGLERAALDANLTPSLYTEDSLDRLQTAAAGATVGVHVKVDTGMHRVGVWPPADLAAYVGRVRDRGFALDALWTHLARSEEDPATTKEQLDRFQDAVASVRSAGHEPGMLHAANTAGSILYPEARLDLVRTGIGIYGVEPASGVGAALGLRAAMTWRSAVIMAKRLAAGERISYGHRYELERDAWIATVPVGYADGYPRALSSRADVLIGGRRCRVAGSVTMDQLMVDCGDHEPRAGEPVVLLGTQGDEVVTANELGALAGSIGYEILARVGARVPRRFIGARS